MAFERFTPGDGAGSRPTPLADSLDRVLAGLGSPPASSLAVVQQAWADLVGPVAAAALVPVGIRDGALIVVADDPAWVGQARWFEAAVIEGLTPLLGPGVVTSVKGRLGPR